MKWLLFFLAVFLTSATKAEEKILWFHSNIQIAADGWLTVTETIVVQVEGQQIQRGILRDFPTDYRDRLGRRVTVPFHVLEVEHDGEAEPWSASRQANGVSVRIGDPNLTLAHRTHRYKITYRTRYQLGFFDDHDELYWNVNGNGWTFAMDVIAADVALPQAVPAAQLKAEAYTGSFGAKGRDYVAQVRHGGAAFGTTRKLRAGEGLTIVFSFPKGVVAPPTVGERFERWLNDNRGEVFGAAGFLLLLAFLYWRWTAVGRDARAGPPFPRYEAPAGLGPAGVGYVDQMGTTYGSFTSALLGLGQRGYLKIRENAGAYELERTGKSVEWLPGEAAVAALVPPQGVRHLGKAYNREVLQVIGEFAAALDKHFGDRLFSSNVGTVYVGLALGVAILGAMYFFGAALPVIIAAAILMVICLFVAWKLLPAYTAEGRRLQDEIEGLRQYLSVAEKDDLARQKRPPRTTEEFAKFLPYAVALGVAKTWADEFANVLGAAALAGAAADYYSSSSPDSGFSTDRFTSSLDGLGDAILAASTPPASSSGSSSSGSSSGGGSSGGGGGGGGGRGW